MKTSFKPFSNWKFVMVSGSLTYLLIRYFVPDLVLNRVIYRTQTLQGCMCERKLFYDSIYTNSRSNLSSCSDEGTYYERNQNVVSYTFYQGVGDEDPRDFYVKCLKHNIQMMRKYYPGYSMRLYTNLPLDPEFCSILCSNNDVFWCNIYETPSDGDASGMVFRTWRFLAFGDPTVQVFLSRDLDSPISAREATVVKDWLEKGDKAISLMRDHYQHGWKMLAGMWQVNNTMLVNGTNVGLRSKIIELSKDSRVQKDKTSDQKILKKVIYDKIPDEIVAYDSFFCVKFHKETQVRPFITQRVDPKTDFVGSVLSCTNMGCKSSPGGSGPCPAECRPDYGKNWTYC